MSGLGTDVVAMACILGGAAMGGVATLASRGADHVPMEVACAVEAVESPQVVVAMGGDRRAIVVTPDVRIHASHGCRHVVQEDVRVRVEAARHEMERARERVERAQVRVERARERARVRLERVDAQGLEEARRQLEALGLELEGLRIEGLELEGLDELIESEIEGRLQEEMELLEKRLEGSEDEAGR